LKNIRYYDISTDLSSASFKDVYKDDNKRVPILKYMTEFIKDYDKGQKPKGLYLNGSFGSGKTYLVSALFNDLAKKGVKCAIVYYPEFLRDLKASFNSEYKNEFNEKYNKIKKAPLLLIDDLGADSLDIVELIMSLEEEFDIEIPDSDAEKVVTVGDVVDYIKENV